MPLSGVDKVMRHRALSTSSMPASSQSDDSKRLLRLRKALGMTQRELASEFGVTGGAIHHWEQGIRPIPGPVMKLIELYEQHLDEESDPETQNTAFRKLSSTWTDRTLTAVRSISRFPQHGIREELQKALFGFLKNEISKDIIKRRVQIAVIHRAIDSIGQMKGLPIKAAQLLTYMLPEIGPEIREALNSIQYMRHPLAPTIVARIIYEDLGASPTRLFAEWSPKPFATASIGQVHLARLKTGEQVAVKVQYPGIRDSIASDFEGITFLHAMASLVKPGNREILDHIHKIVLDECDYETELERIEEFRSIFEGDPEIVIPKPFPKLSSKRVLTMEYLDGKSLDEFKSSSSQQEKDLAAKLIWKFTILSQMKHGLMNADAHAGNFIFMKDRVGFVDYGRVYQLPETLIKAYRELCVGFSIGKRARAKAAISDLLFVRSPETFNFDEFWKMMEVQQRHGVAGTSFRFSHSYIADGVRASKFFPRDQLKLTPDMLWCGCSSNGIWSIFAELQAEGRWGDWMLEILEEAQPS